jgi:hypothetical protein
MIKMYRKLDERLVRSRGFLSRLYYTLFGQKWYRWEHRVQEWLIRFFLLHCLSRFELQKMQVDIRVGWLPVLTFLNIIIEKFDGSEFKKSKIKISAG